MQPNHQVQQPEASQAQQLSPATPSPSSLAAAAAAAPPLPPGMDAKLYKAASSGSFEAISHISNWKHQLTPTQNNILHIHVGKSPFFKKVKRADLRDAMVDIEFIKKVLQDDEGYWMLWKQNNNGDTPLHIAARFGHYDAVKAFLEQAKKVYQPADDVKRMLKMTNNKKDTTLHVVARAGHAEVVKLLMEADPDCAHNKPNEKGETPVYLAAESGSTTSVLSILQNYKALDLAYKGPCGRTALHAAVQWGGPLMVEKIVEKGRWLMTIQDEKGLTPLHCAASQQQTIGLLKILLDEDKHERQSSATYIRDNMGRTPLHIAMLQQNYDALDKLIESTPDCIEIVDNNGQNVLHYAAKWAFPTTTHWLSKRALHFDKYINDRDTDGNTPLHIFAAAVNRNPDLPFICNMLNSVVINYPSVDLKAFDKQNHSVGDIFGSYSELGHLERVQLRKFQRGKRKNTYERDNYDQEKLMINGGEWDVEVIKKSAESRLIVAALIATVSFAAGFTVPGGLVQNEGKEMGMAVFKRKPSFIVFLVSDAIAFATSTTAILFYFLITSIRSKTLTRFMSIWGFMMNTIAVAFMMIAFVAAVCAVSSKVLSITIIIISVLFSIFYFGMLINRAARLARLSFSYQYFLLRPFRQ